MKKMLLLFVTLFGLSSLSAQQSVQISNTLSCDLMVQMYEFDASCNNTTAVNYFVGAGTTITVNAAAGNEYTYAEIHSWPLCSPGLGMALGAPSACSNCSWGAPSSDTLPSYGCSGCPPVVNGVWVCANKKQGVMRFF